MLGGMGRWLSREWMSRWRRLGRTRERLTVTGWRMRLVIGSSRMLGTSECGVGELGHDAASQYAELERGGAGCGDGVLQRDGSGGA